MLKLLQSIFASTYRTPTLPASALQSIEPPVEIAIGNGYTFAIAPVKEGMPNKHGIMPIQLFSVYISISAV